MATCRHTSPLYYFFGFFTFGCTKKRHREINGMRWEIADCSDPFKVRGHPHNKVQKWTFLTTLQALVSGHPGKHKNLVQLLSSQRTSKAILLEWPLKIFPEGCQALCFPVFWWGERETRVTVDEAQGTMGRRKTWSLAGQFSPSRLLLRANYNRERR